MHKHIALCLLFLMTLQSVPVVAQSLEQTRSAVVRFRPVPEVGDTANLLLALRRAGFTGRVLQITAHADDENHGALTYLSRRLGARVGLLTLTHGEAFGNALDDRVGSALGALRTQELLAADQYYGVDQFFTRAMDSGTVKDGPTALRLWGHEAVLEDVVRIIRFYRPDVIISRWQGNERDGHGHHSAAGLLTREAFRAAADAKRFPDQIAEGLAPWQAKKLYMNWLTRDQISNVQIDAGEYDALLGCSYTELGARGLSLQRSQVQRTHAWRGPAVYRFQLIDQVFPTRPNEDSIFEGIETTLSGLSQLAGPEEKKIPWLHEGLAEVARNWRIALDSFKASDPSAVAPNIFAALKSLRQISDQVIHSHLSAPNRRALEIELRQKLADFEEVAARILGLKVEALVDPYESPGTTLVPGVGGLPLGANFVTPGQKFSVTGKLWNRSPVKITVESCDLETNAGWEQRADQGKAVDLTYNQAASYKISVQAPESATYSQPVWKQPKPHDQLLSWFGPFARFFAVRTPALIGHCRYRAFGVEANLSGPVKVFNYDRLQGEQEQDLKVVPALSVQVDPRRKLLTLKAAGRELPIEVTLRNQMRGNTTGQVRLEVPPGWGALPPQQFQFSRDGEGKTFNFKPRVPETVTSGELTFRVVAQANGKEYAFGYDRIEYPQLEPEHLYYPAELALTIVDAKTPAGLKVGYIQGQGGNKQFPRDIAGLGVEVDSLTEFTFDRMKDLDAVLIGSFGFNVRPQLRAAIPELTRYVEQGGVVIALSYAVVDPVVPYPIEPREGAAGWGPYSYRLPGNVFRSVVDMQASVRLLAPEHPVLNTPNKISEQDFQNWISAFAAGIAEEWDSHYQPLLSFREADGRETQGSLLIARHGQGYLVHSGLTFNLQLTSGTPGATRLLANLLSLRRTSVQSNK